MNELQKLLEAAKATEAEHMDLGVEDLNVDDMNVMLETTLAEMEAENAAASEELGDVETGTQFHGAIIQLSNMLGKAEDMLHELESDDGDYTLLASTMLNNRIASEFSELGSHLADECGVEAKEGAPKALPSPEGGSEGKKKDKGTIKKIIDMIKRKIAQMMVAAKNFINRWMSSTLRRAHSMNAVATKTLGALAGSGRNMNIDTSAVVAQKGTMNGLMFSQKFRMTDVDTAAAKFVKLPNGNAITKMADRHWKALDDEHSLEDGYKMLADFTKSCAAMYGIKNVSHDAKDSIALPIMLLGGRKLVVRSSSEGVLMIRQQDGSKVESPEFKALSPKECMAAMKIVQNVTARIMQDKSHLTDYMKMLDHGNEAGKYALGAMQKIDGAGGAISEYFAFTLQSMREWGSLQFEAADDMIKTCESLTRLVIASMKTAKAA